MADDSGLFRCSLGKQGADVINLLSAEPQQLGRHPLPLTRVESQATTFTVIDPMELAGHAPLGATSQAGDPPLLRLDAVGWALTSVASSISTSGSGVSCGSAESDADNSEKISLKTPLSHQWRQRL